MKPKQPHENEPGYRFCGLCEAWFPADCFRPSALSHDGLSAVCALHHDMAAHEKRVQSAREALSRAGIRSRSPIVCRDIEAQAVNERQKQNERRRSAQATA